MFKEIQQGWKRVSLPLAEMFGFFLIWLNFHIAVLLPKLNISFVINDQPFGFDISIAVTFFIIIFIIVALYKSTALDRYPLASILIIAGAFSNFIERLYFGGVRDYLDIQIAHINLADIEIWTGLILLNFQVWFSDNSKGKTDDENYEDWLEKKAKTEIKIKEYDGDK